MRILWISHFLLYPDTGYGALQRSRNLLKELCKYHDVILVCLIRNPDRELVPDLKTAEKDLRGYCKKVFFVDHDVNTWKRIFFAFKSFITDVPYSVSLYRSGKLMEEILRLSSDNQPDVVHVDTIGLAETILDKIDAVKILNHHDIESHKMYRRYRNEKNILKHIFFQHENGCLERYEKKYCREYDMNVVVSEIDRRRLHDMAGEIRIGIVENGVDCEYFRFHPRDGTSRELIFTGALDYYPNVKAVNYFCSEIWPILKRNYPDLKFTVIGKNPPEHILSTTESHAGINILGYVEDVRPHIKRARIFVCPILEGGGTRIKILDAFSQGIPVVSTEVGAEGLNLENGKNIFIAKTGTEFVNGISSLLDDIELGERISRNAREFVERTYSYELIGKKMASMYGNIADNRSKSWTD